MYEILKYDPRYFTRHNLLLNTVEYSTNSQSMHPLNVELAFYGIFLNSRSIFLSNNNRFIFQQLKMQLITRTHRHAANHITIYENKIIVASTSNKILNRIYTIMCVNIYIS